MWQKGSISLKTPQKNQIFEILNSVHAPKIKITWTYAELDGKKGVFCVEISTFSYLKANLSP